MREIDNATPSKPHNHFEVKKMSQIDLTYISDLSNPELKTKTTSSMSVQASDAGNPFEPEYPQPLGSITPEPDETSGRALTRSARTSRENPTYSEVHEVMSESGDIALAHEHGREESVGTEDE
jgi:hypothetical protein